MAVTPPKPEATPAEIKSMLRGTLVAYANAGNPARKLVTTSTRVILALAAEAGYSIAKQGDDLVIVSPNGETE